MTRLPAQVFEPASAGRERQTRERHAGKQAVSKCLMHVADRVELGAHRSRIDLALIALEARSRRLAVPDRLERRFSREHAGSHREMNAFETHRIEESAGI